MFLAFIKFSSSIKNTLLQYLNTFENSFAVSKFYQNGRESPPLSDYVFSSNLDSIPDFVVNPFASSTKKLVH